MPIDFTRIDPEEFELLCEDLLQAMGFSIEAQVARGPDLGKDIIAAQTVADRAGFAETHRYLVECKHYAKSGKSVQESDIGSPVARMSTHKCDRYILATSTVPSEKVRTQLAGIPNTVPHYRATTWSKGDLTRLLDEHPAVRQRYFPPEVVEAATPAGALADTVEGLLTVMGFACQERQAADDRVQLVCTSKGAFARPLAVVCKEGAVERGDVDALLADPDRQRIPILISLRDYAKAMNLEQLVTDFLVNRYDIQAGYEAFRRFNADGKLVLLFDGFDEMAQKVDYQTTADNFEELARAVEARSKVLLTCRTPYFRTSREAEELLSRRDDLPESWELSGRLIDLTDRPNFEIVHLLPFDQGDIQAMLRARFPDEWERHWQRIEDTYNLAELAQRPVLLDMIARSLPELKPGQAVNAARLYEAYTDLWLARDEEKGRKLITRGDKRLFMQELTLEMLRRAELSIHYSRLPERVREYFRLEKAHEIDYFEHDIRTCSFLNRDAEGNYRFVHKSFQEFFVAQWLAPKLMDGSAPEMGLNEEMRGFVRGLLAEADWPPPPPEGMEAPEGMVWLPPGPFIMGAEGEEGGTRVVRLEQGVFVARTPVTNAQYARFVAATRHQPPEHWKGQAPPEKLRDHPVVYVSWNDAVAYAEWAGGRLLTEQEWEKAARGMDGRIYPWGDAFDPARCNTLESSIRTTTSVGKYSPGGDGPYGAADMAGNVWEWCADWYDEGKTYKVLRGGSWFFEAGDVRSANRHGFTPVNRDYNVGFRCARGSGTTETLSENEDTEEGER